MSEEKGASKEAMPASRRPSTKQLLVTFAVAVLVGVSLGLAFGTTAGPQFFHLRGRQKNAAGGPGLAAGQKLLRVLAIKGALPPEIVVEFQKSTGIAINLTEASEPEELWQLFDAPGAGTTYDVVSLMSYQVPAAVQLMRLQTLDTNKIDLTRVGSDFRGIPGDANQTRLVPLLWGATGLLYNTEQLNEAPVSWKSVFALPRLKGRVGLLNFPVELARRLKNRAGANEVSNDEESELGPSDDTIVKGLKPILALAVLADNCLSTLTLTTRPREAVVEMNHGETAFLPAQHWQFVWPEEKAPLWILSFALTQETKAEREGYRFLNFLLDAETAVKLTNATHQASTVVSVERLKIDARLKPSYLREIPLTKIEILHDFQGASAVHAALQAKEPTSE
jgi:spermidine/putrescine transport system substrate-binding protein